MTNDDEYSEEEKADGSKSIVSRILDMNIKDSAKSNSGMILGVTIGFISGLSINIALLPISIVIGTGYDIFKNIIRK